MNVIIPTTGKRQTQLLECINSLKSQTFEVKITVVLGTSSTYIKHQIEKLCTENNCQLLFEPYTKLCGSHRAVACNHGLKHTQSDIVAFVDDDVSVPPTWAETSIKYFKNSVAGVTSGCKPYTSPFHLVQKIGSDAHSKQFTKITTIKSIPGYNSIYRRQVLNLVGNFNTHIGGCEDWELNYRIRKSGWKLLGIPETPVEHRHSYTWKSFIKQMFGYGWSRSRLMRTCHVFTFKHSFPSLALLSFLPLLLFPPALFFILILYLIFLSILSIYVNPKRPFNTLLTFIIMYLSWSLGYLKGLIR